MPRHALVFFQAALILAHAIGVGSCSAAEDRSEPRLRERFDADWRFQRGDLADAESPALDDSAWRRLDLPHDWSVELPFDPGAASGTGYLPGGVGWYRKTFNAPAAWSGREVDLHLDGVYRNSQVWINGELVGGRPSGYLPVSVRLTPHLRLGEPNTVAVRVAREEVADSRWYPGTGIYRHVWLEVTDPVSVDRWGTFVTTPRVSDTQADVVVTNTIRNRLGRPLLVRVETELVGPDGASLTRQSSEVRTPAGSTESAEQWHVVQSPRRWSVDTPNLYTAITRVYDGERLIDQTHTEFGVRTFRFDPDSGFTLNGEPLLIKGLCLHHDGGVVGAAVPDDVLLRRLKLVKELGANAVRCSHNPMAEELYAFCDRLGLLVMDEAFDEWELGKRKWVSGRNVGVAERLGPNEHFTEWGERDAADMVRRSRNHPSVILWSIGNEIDYPGDPYAHPDFFDPDAPPVDEGSPSVARLSAVAPRLIAAVKREDPTRPVTMALSNTPASNDIGLANMLDVCGYNYQEQFYESDHAEFPGRVLYGSESGQGRRSWRAVVEQEHISGQFLWVGFDFLGEAGRWPNHGSRAGVFDTRGVLKPWNWWRKAEWDTEPFVRILVADDSSAGERSRGRRARYARHPRLWRAEEGDPTRVVLVTNCEVLDVRLNGRSIETTEAPWASGLIADIPFEAGELVATGLNGGDVIARDALRTPGPAARLDLSTSREVLDANGRDVAFIEVRVVDAEGTGVSDWEGPITIGVSGAGRLLGVDNGNQDDPTMLKSPTKQPIDGSLLAIVQSLREAGPIEIEATAPGLSPATVTVRSEAE